MPKENPIKQVKARNAKWQEVIDLLEQIESMGADVNMYFRLMFPARVIPRVNGVPKPTDMNIMRLKAIIRHLEEKQNLSGHERKKKRGRRAFTNNERKDSEVS